MYLALMICNFKQQFQYRSSLYIRIIGSMLWVYIQVCIWTALFRNGATGGELQDLITYIVISFLISELTSNGIASMLAQKVKDGSIEIDLIRPVSLKWYLFYHQLSENIFSFLFMGIPVTVVSALLWGIYFPANLNFLLCVISVCMAIVLTFYFQYVVGLFVFWVKDVSYTQMITGGIVTIFSGSTIPLWYYPAFLKHICEFLPFRLMVFEPISIFLGRYQFAQAIRILLIQLFWILIFTILEKFIWVKIQKSITIQGG